MPENIQLFQSLFLGRRDVFAVRWEKGTKHGYSPAYTFDPYHYRLHKIKGGNLSDYKDKTLRVLNDEEIAEHLAGIQHIGLYPLMPDNTSWFIAVDFDGSTWQKDCQILMEKLRELGITGALERSRSGDGGHVWIFFEKAYPANKSRKILIKVLQDLSMFSQFDKEASFDRLFPSQDYHTGKAFGNLIALPLQGASVKKGNCSFVDPYSFDPYPDQWKFLENLQKVPSSKLDEIEIRLFGARAAESESTDYNADSGTVSISLSNKIRINPATVPEELRILLQDELSFSNSEFYAKKQSGRNTYGTKRFFSLVEERHGMLFIPRGNLRSSLCIAKNSLNNGQTALLLFCEFHRRRLALYQEGNIILAGRSPWQPFRVFQKLLMIKRFQI